MKAILVNFNHTPNWLLESGLDYYIYDRSDSKEYLKDFPQERIKYTENIGNVDYDKLSYLIDHYYNLPEVFIWGKTNLLRYVNKEMLDQAIAKKQFTPLLRQDHKTYSDRLGPVNYYQEGMYHERNDSWYLNEHPSKYFQHMNQWLSEFFITPQRYIPFPPGGNFILTREKVHMYGIDTYQKMRDLMDYTVLPGEAQMAERTYFMLWNK